MSKKTLELANDFNWRYNSKNRKANRRRQGIEEKAGNFSSTFDGDLKPSVYLTKHAKKRMKERGVSVSEAIKGKTKAGAIITPGGAVVTVVPDSWARNHAMCKAPRSKTRNHRISNVPKKEALPKDHSIVEIKSDYMGHLLGKKHANISKHIRKYPKTKYEVVKGSLWIWGPKEKVECLRCDIKRHEQKVAAKCGPPIPNGTLSADQTRRRIVIPEVLVGNIVGKNGANIKKLREECEITAVSINMQSNVMNVWGEAATVDAVCKRVATAVAAAKSTEKRRRARKAAVAKKSLMKKMEHHKRKQKQAAKNAAREARTIVVDKSTGKKTKKGSRGNKK